MQVYRLTIPSFICDQWQRECLSFNANNVTGLTECHSLACPSLVPPDHNVTSIAPMVFTTSYTTSDGVLVSVHGTSTTFDHTTMATNTTVVTVTAPGPDATAIVRTEGSLSTSSSSSATSTTSTASTTSVKHDTTATTLTSMTSASTTDLSAGAKAGVGTGVAVTGLLVVAALLAFVSMRKSRKKHALAATSGEKPNEADQQTDFDLIAGHDEDFAWTMGKSQLSSDPPLHVSHVELSTEMESKYAPYRVSKDPAELGGQQVVAGDAEPDSNEQRRTEGVSPMDEATITDSTSETRSPMSPSSTARLL